MITLELIPMIFKCGYALKPSEKYSDIGSRTDWMSFFPTFEGFTTLELIAGWKGILISDGYGLYRKWIHGRQTCLAHLIRKAKALTESKKLNEGGDGQLIGAHLKTLIAFSKKKPPT